MNIKKYLESGILEQYCLGLLSEEEESSVQQICALYPEIKSELTSIEDSLEVYANVHAVSPGPETKEKILKAMEQQPESDEWPLISESSDYKTWLKSTAHLFPEELKDEKFYKVLQETETFSQILLASATDFEEEIHDDVYESFLILEGECECTVGDEVFRLTAGSFTAIPLNQPHHVKIISPLKAVLQWVAV